MPRVKRGTKRRANRAKTLDRASGFFLTKSKLYRSAQEAVEKALKYAYVGRKQKKRNYRSLWIVRIGAAAREIQLFLAAIVHDRQQAGLAQQAIGIDHVIDRHNGVLAGHDPQRLVRGVGFDQAAGESGDRAV